VKPETGLRIPESEQESHSTFYPISLSGIRNPVSAISYHLPLDSRSRLCSNPEKTCGRL